MLDSFMRLIAGNIDVLMATIIILLIVLVIRISNTDKLFEGLAKKSALQFSIGIFIFFEVAKLIEVFLSDSQIFFDIKNLLLVTISAYILDQLFFKTQQTIRRFLLITSYILICLITFRWINDTLNFSNLITGVISTSIFCYVLYILISKKRYVQKTLLKGILTTLTYLAGLAFIIVAIESTQLKVNITEIVQLSTNAAKIFVVLEFFKIILILRAAAGLLKKISEYETSEKTDDRIKIYIRYFAVTFIISIFVMIISIQYVALNTQNTTIKMNVDHLRIVEQSINPSILSTIPANRSSTSSTNWKSLQQQIIRMNNSIPDFRYVYIMEKLEDNVIKFVVDSEPSKYTSIDDPLSNPGDIYSEASEVLVQSFDKTESSYEGPLADQWGNWVSFFIPINNGDGRKLIIGADWDASNWYSQIYYERIKIEFFFLIYAVIIGFIYNTMIRESYLTYNIKISQQKYKLLFDSSAHAIMIISLDGKIEDINDKTAILLKRSKKQILFKNILHYMPEYIRPGKKSSAFMKEQVEKVLTSTETEFEIKLRKSNDDLFYCEVTAKKHQEGETTRIQLVLEDTTQKHKSEQLTEKHVDELERINRLMVNRELKMIELKKQIKSLENNNA
jgi:PAS domain S-box-containing protein